MPVSIRCEQSTQQGNSLDVWLGRLAMVGFAVAITVEISTGKGLLEVWYSIYYVVTSELLLQAWLGPLALVCIFEPWSNLSFSSND